MTRKDIIIEEALSYSDCSKEWFDDKSYCGESTPYDDAHSFVHGAEWADETMIDKACLWLRETAHFYVSEFTGELDYNGLIEDFRKAMEE